MHILEIDPFFLIQTFANVATAAYSSLAASMVHSHVSPMAAAALHWLRINLDAKVERAPKA